jgi:hypothetical protein
MQRAHSRGLVPTRSRIFGLAGYRYYSTVSLPAQIDADHDLTAGMTPREILIGLAYIGQMIDLGDRDLQATSVDQAGKFCKHLGIRRGAVALRLDAVFRGRRKVDDRIDPIGRDTE